MELDADDRVLAVLQAHHLAVAGEGGGGHGLVDERHQDVDLFVLGDREGTTCEPAFTVLVRDALADMGYDVKDVLPCISRGARDTTPP